MDTWITKLAQEYTPATETGFSNKGTEVKLIINTDNVDIEKLHRLLQSNGFPILDISFSSVEQQKPIQEGTIVQTQNAVVAGAHCIMKTPTNKYTVDEAVLPAGYIGEVVHLNKESAVVNFDANIQVTAVDQSGYISKVAFYVGTLEVKKNNIKAL